MQALKSSSCPTFGNIRGTNGEKIHLTKAEVRTAIKCLKADKALRVDDIRPEMLKVMNNFEVRWLTRVCQVAWKTGEVPKQWQTSVLIPIHKKGHKKKCTNYRSNYSGVSL